MSVTDDIASETVTAADIRIGDVVNFPGFWLDTMWAKVASPVIHSKYDGLSGSVEFHFADGTTDIVAPHTVVRRHLPARSEDSWLDEQSALADEADERARGVR